jgi:hypothetical protein
VSFTAENFNGRGELHIYRSTGGPENFARIDPTPHPDYPTLYFERNLKPRTDYYYTAQVVDGEQTSDFSDTLVLTTESNFYIPELTATVTEEGHVKLLLQDKSYADVIYDIVRDEQSADGSTFSDKEISMPDSGSYHQVVDTTVGVSATYTYRVHALVEEGDGMPYYQNVAVKTVTVTQENAPLIPPHLETYFSTVGTTVYFNAENFNSGGEIHFYRSTSEDEGYVRVYPTPYPGLETVYYQENLKPRTAYYYTAQVVDGERTSDFSDTLRLTTESNFYNPELKATITEEGHVKLVLQDKSYADVIYDIVRDEKNADGSTFSDKEIVMSDSGSYHEVVDTSVAPNNTYTYRVHALVEEGDGMPYYQNVAVITITTPEEASGPEITGFVLVDPYNDTDVSTLVDYDTIRYSERYNIRANATDDTESVEFFLNGKRWGENQEPYALFGDRKGNYNRGRLRPGDYTLTATAYRQNLHKGEKGKTSTIHFTVIDDRNVDGMSANEEAIVQIDVFPNPVISTASVEISAPENALVTVDLRNENGQTFRLTQDKIGSDKLMFTDFNASTVSRGVWYMIVTVDKKTFTKRVIVK